MFTNEKGKLIEIVNIIMRKMFEDYIHLFISLNRNSDASQDLKDNLHNYIKFLYSLQNLPFYILEKIIEKF